MSDAKRIRIVLVDDEQMVRSGLRMIRRQSEQSS